MEVLKSNVNTKSQDFIQNKERFLSLIDDLNQKLISHGQNQGEEAYKQRHKKRGKLLARERIELLLDQDSPFLELSPLLGYEKEKVTAITGIGIVSGVECVIFANIPTVRGGAINEYTTRKWGRADAIATQNRLPMILLVETAGADLSQQAKVFHNGGGFFRSLAEKSKRGIPSISVVFGSSTAGGAYTPAMSDYVVMIKNQSMVYLGGPPLVKMATGEETDDESLGGATMHSKISGVSDYLAEDEDHGIFIARQIVSYLNYKKNSPFPIEHLGMIDEPIYSPDEILGIASTDIRVPYDSREIIARIVDGSRFHEFKPFYGTTMVTGWARIHGFLVGILANNGVMFSNTANKTAQFIQICDRRGIPLLFLHNITGFMVGKSYEEGGIIKHGAHTINALSNRTVPAVSIIMGASYGAANYAMCGRAYSPNFLFTWPCAKVAVMGAEQLAGVMTIVYSQSAARSKKTLDPSIVDTMRETFKSKLESESTALYYSGEGLDDGIIDPRDTRSILGICFSVIYSGDVLPGGQLGIHRL
eukprot:TRINITY_DN727_c0_g1_i5.p1 TRINITY_DN727_c0_g1~~TRINITY_DN727_c0_g1_i5.p1  ORF type:complete len:533 (-),score=92.28 TRINITY_DN727_c0_g1_i5:78-1676(-)